MRNAFCWVLFLVGIGDVFVGSLVGMMRPFSRHFDDSPSVADLSLLLSVGLLKIAAALLLWDAMT